MMNQGFKGFTPQQTEVLARKMGYTGEMNSFKDFLAQNPEHQSKFSGYEKAANNRLTKSANFAAGGLVSIDSIQQGEGYKKTQEMMNNPEASVPQVDVQQLEAKPGEILNSNNYQVGNNPNVQGTTATNPTATQAPQITATKTEGKVETATQGMEAAQGTVSAQAQVDAAAMNPQNLAQLGYSAEQIQEAQKIQSPAPRTLEAGESVSGSAVDMARVNEALDLTAATADPSKKATVQGQLEGLMQQFEDGQTPAWAAGAMRTAQQQLIARGLGASSIAGQAVVQAAMESALPIAAQDASTYASFESQNLSNRQQTKLFAAEQRAKFLGQEFDQTFQTKVLNAAKISDIANLNFTAEQQVALENARLAQTVDLANLDARSAKLMADMAAMSQVDLANLNNRQQAAVLNAQSFLAMDMANLESRQQMEMFKSQSIVQSLFTDAAAENAAKQFNATSQMQTDQFFADLGAKVNMFNAAQTQDADKFNRTMNDARDQFNMSNRLIIDQSNAQWRRTINTTNTAAQNEANMFEAQAALGLTTAAYNNMMQVERDLYSFAYDASQKAKDRASQLLLAQYQMKAQGKAGMGQAVGALAGSLVNNIFEMF